ncbi:hypothetical protein SAMN04487977_10922 [Treponema bryantii]|uniref:Uncharacterized protein n=1 Tax=Treponema bryantii TaxID=163 RepID=A0A1H9I9B5_9SPIR|nr:hypothetical protein [Treponema bryantii]SEQ71140.1 hypothetical protein SAMN04487977_10922 [Treponema bryantii]
MKKTNYFIKLFSPLLTLFVIAFIVFTCWTYLSSWNAATSLPSNIPQEFLRIKIYGSSSEIEGVGSTGSTVSGTFSIIDSNGNEIAVIERSWSGSYLAVEFARVGVDGKYFIFPSRIYGKNRIIEERRERSHGTLLEKYYDDYGQCMLLGYGSTLRQRKLLYRIAVFATGKYHVPGFSLMSRFSIDLSGCRPDRYYSIGFNADGGYVIEEL